MEIIDLRKIYGLTYRRIKWYFINKLPVYMQNNNNNDGCYKICFRKKLKKYG